MRAATAHAPERYSSIDLSTPRVQRFFLAQKYPRRDHIERVTRALAATTPGERVDLDHLDGGEPERKRSVLLCDLERLGVIEPRDNGFCLREITSSLERRGAELSARYEELRRADRERLDAMLAYADASTCRTAEILRYFGESPPPHCAHCDNCEEQRHWIRRRQGAEA